MSFDVHHLCPDRSTCLITLQDVESNPEPATDPARRAKLPSCRALGYQRSQLAPPGTARLPEGWREVTVTSTLGTGVDLFGAVSDDLLELAAHVRAGIRMSETDPAYPGDVDFLDGPMRGPCRLVDRTDESLRQGLVVGTLEGNRTVAEHRCHVDLDPDTGEVTATARTAWRAGTYFILPGGARRESQAFRRMSERVLRALSFNA